MTYPKSAFGSAADAVTPSPSFPAIEREILDFWESDDTFRASIAQAHGVVSGHQASIRPSPGSSRKNGCAQPSRTARGRPVTAAVRGASVTGCKAGWYRGWQQSSS